MATGKVSRRDLLKGAAATGGALWISRARLASSQPLGSSSQPSYVLASLSSGVELIPNCALVSTPPRVSARTARKHSGVRAEAARTTRVLGMSARDRRWDRRSLSRRVTVRVTIQQSRAHSFQRYVAVESNG